MRGLMRRAMHLLRRRQFDADLAEEMAFHREMVERDLEARGVSAAEARNAAGRAFGSAALTADQSRDVWLLGLAGALATGQLLRRFLVNTPARDPLTLVAVALLLVVVALTACLLPARRAARIDPVLALRYE